MIDTMKKSAIGGLSCFLGVKFYLKEGDILPFAHPYAKKYAPKGCIFAVGGCILFGGINSDFNRAKMNRLK